MRVALSDIEMDTGIQCRAAIDMAVVNQYAERMTESDQFPPVQLFTRNGRHWIGDGWHRIMAAQSIGAKTIDAEVRDGGRHDALVHALGANAQHGHRRTNADKRRCVEIALEEFAQLSTNAIAQLCGVHDEMVSRLRADLPESGTLSVVVGNDGKQYPAKRRAKTEEAPPMQEHQPLKHNTPKTEVAAEISRLLAEGHNVEQIAEQIGRSVDLVRVRINEFGLIKIEKRGRGSARISPRDVIEETVNAVSATSHGLRLIRKSEISIPQVEAAALLAEITEAMNALRWLVNVLKGQANG